MNAGVKTAETHHVVVSELEPADPTYTTVTLRLPGTGPVEMSPQDAQRLGQLLNRVGRGEHK